MKERGWWVLACVAIQVGWMSPYPAAAQQPMTAQAPVAGQEPLFPQAPTQTREPMAGQEPLFPQVPPCTQMQEPTPAPRKWGGQFFFSAGGASLPDSNRLFTEYSGTGQNWREGFSLTFGTDVPIVRDPLFGNTLLGELAMNYAQFSNSYQTVSEMALIGAPKYRIEWGNLRPWVIPVGMEFLLATGGIRGNGVNVGMPFGAGLDYMLSRSVSIGVDWRYNLNLSPSSVNFGSFMTYGGYLGFNF